MGIKLRKAMDALSKNDKFLLFGGLVYKMKRKLHKVGIENPQFMVVSGFKMFDVTRGDISWIMDDSPVLHFISDPWMDYALVQDAIMRAVAEHKLDIDCWIFGPIKKESILQNMARELLKEVFNYVTNYKNYHRLSSLDNIEGTNLIYKKASPISFTSGNLCVDFANSCIWIAMIRCNVAQDLSETFTFSLITVAMSYPGDIVYDMVRCGECYDDKPALFLPSFETIYDLICLNMIRNFLLGNYDLANKLSAKKSLFDLSKN